jgi:serine/threonine protein kinase
MNAERWAEIEPLYHAALDKGPEERASYLEAACGEDAGLRKEVESLLAFADGSLASPTPRSELAQLWDQAVAPDGRAVAVPPAALGWYRIVHLLGEGGMGKVYRATDTKLRREVAIKVLPREFQGDPARLARFEREAQVLASLNHPHIGAIYGLEAFEGVPFLVLELVEGPTLAERIARGPVPPDEALAIAEQIIEALEYAHERSVVHRDLKPANIKLTPDGSVKVLDFGLAKALADPVSASNPADSPTVTIGPTAAGVILGTAAYMSPEQAGGKPLDKRTDIWSFGVVLYEMLTGKPLFRGETIAEMLASVLKDVPDFEGVPAQFRPLLPRCLEKDRTRRLRDIGDALAILENAPVSVAKSTPSRIVWTLAAAAAVFALAFCTLSFVHFREATPEARVMTTSILAPENTTFSFNIPVTSRTVSPPELSPDGKRIVFAARAADGSTQLWVRPLDSLTAQPLAGSGGATFPFWSPDSRSIAFFADGKLKRIDTAGGVVLTLADAPFPRGGSWSHRGVIIFGGSFSGPLQRISDDGRASAPATKFDARKELFHYSPWFLPDGRHFLFGVIRTGFGEITLQIGALDSQEVRAVGSGGSAMYSDGYLLYMRENALMAQPFDAHRLATTGEARPVAAQVESRFSSGTIVGMFSVSRERLLAYHSGSSGSQQLTWFDRSGKAQGALGNPSYDFVSVEFSPDRKSVAVSRRDQDSGLWIYDVSRGRRTRVALGGDLIWSPDGKTFVYSYSSTDGRGTVRRRLYRAAADGTSKPEVLLEGALGLASSWSPDGAIVAYTRMDSNESMDIWMLPLGTGSPSKPYPWLATPSQEAYGKFSPDGQWVAYDSDDSGRDEIYVAPFPGPGPRRQISVDGGSRPRWRADGKEIFYIGLNDRLMAAEVSTKAGGLEVGTIRQLNIPAGLFDVSADGQRFLVAAPREQQSSAPLTLVENWTALLKKK